MSAVLLGGLAGLLLKGIAAAFLIVFLVVVHESGHFFAAKLFGVAVPVFSVGMGARVWGFERGGTDYRVSALPVGGYVLLAGADPFGEEDPEAGIPPEQSFMHKPVWQRLIIMSAGPVSNLVLPVLLFTAVLMAGEPQVAPNLGLVVPGTLAAGTLQPGDQVLAVDDRVVDVWNDLTDALKGEGERHAWRIRRGDETLTVDLPTPRNREGGVDWVKLGIGPSRMSAVIGVDDPRSPAAVAGLRTGDRIVEVDGVAVPDREALMAALTATSGHDVVYERLGFSNPTKPERCATGDDDEDGLVDCADPDCEATCAASGKPHELPRVQARLEIAADYLPDSSVWANPWGIAPSGVFCGGTVAGQAAEASGLARGDRFLSLNGQEVRTFEQFVSLTVDSLKDGQPQPLTVGVRRAGEVLSFTMMPKVQVVAGEAYSRPVIGAYGWSDGWLNAEFVPKYYGFVPAVERAVWETGMVIKGTAALLGNMFVARANPATTVGGPVAIFTQAADVAEQGLFPYMRLLGMISVSLGLINLLPVPVFDGGQILFYLFEAIRGRPLSLAIRERIQMVGVLGLVVVFLLVTANDISRRFGS